MGSTETKNLWLAIGAGIFATFLLYSYSQEKKAELDKQFGTKKRVVIAKQDIGEMDTIYDTMLEYKEIPTDYMEPGTIDNTDDVIGSIAAVPIPKGQQVLKNKLHEPGAETGIASQIAPSKRAITIPVNDQQAVAKLIRPGDRVDILGVIDVGKGVNQRREVQVLMQDVIVLATGVNVVNTVPRTLEKDGSGRSLIQTNLTGDTKYPSLTIELDLKKAQDLIVLVATNPGNIFFALRNPSDRHQVPPMQPSTAESISTNSYIPALDSSRVPANNPAQQPVNSPLNRTGR